MAVASRRTSRTVHPDFVSVSEAAVLLGVHRHTIRSAIAKGTLAAVKLGDTIRIPIVELGNLPPVIEADDADH